MARYSYRKIAGEPSFLAASLIAAAVFLAPLMFGATEPWSQAFLHLLTGLATAIWLLHCRSRITLGWLPVAFLLLTLLQVMPLPKELVTVVAPRSAEAWEIAESATGYISYRLSVSPTQTLLAGQQAFLMAMTVVAVGDLARNPRIARLLMTALGLTALAVLGLGLMFWPYRGGPLLGIHDMRWPTGYKTILFHPMHTCAFGRPEWVRVGGISYLLQYWVVGDTFGPYVVSNHYAGCLEVTIPFLLAVILSVAQKGCEFKTSWMRIFVATALAILAWLTVAFGAQSRAGAACLFLGALFFFQVVSNGALRTMLRALFIISLLLVVLLFAVSYYIFNLQLSDFPQFLLALLSPVFRWIGGATWRVQQWSICTSMFLDSPLVGYGLGSFASVYPHYSASEVRVAFAHCDYFQFLAETGLAGVSIVVIAGITAAKKLLHACAVTSLESLKTARLTALSSLVGFLPHGFVDWNLHIPANAFLFSTACGLLLATVCGPHSSAGMREKPIGRRKLTGYFIKATLLMFICMVMINSALFWQKDRLIYPLRHALAVQVLRNSPMTREDKKRTLWEALPQGIMAASQPVVTGEILERIGQGYLHLSDGQDETYLKEAEWWFTMAVRKEPMRSELYGTILEIKTTLDMLNLIENREFQKVGN